MLTVEQAAEIIRKACPPLDGEWVEFARSSGRILAKNVRAQTDCPPFDRSPLDGFALRAADTEGACRERPAVLKQMETLYAGSGRAEALGPGEAVRVMTGARLPEGADCVVRQEDTEWDGERVRVFTGLKPYENFVFRGEDIKKGEIVLEQGRKIGYIEKGILAAAGVGRVYVRKRPSVCLFSTGDELVAVGETLGAGQIFDSNLPMLEERLAQLGAKPVRCGYLKDSPKEICRTLGEAAKEADLIITTGAVSVGERDVFHQVVEMEGCERIFWKVGMKPGTPLLFWKIDGVPVISLSGNPFAAAATFELLARPALRRLMGERETEPARVAAVLDTPFPKPSRSRRFVRGRLEGGRVTLPKGHSSGMIGSLLDCNCMVDIPAGSGALKEGDQVQVVML